MLILTAFLYLTSIVYIDAQLEMRILSSNMATPEEFPYIVSIRANRQHICGGAIIDYSWVLSAAHCFTIEGLRHAGQLLVVAGTVDLNGVGGTLHGVSNIFIHQNFTNPYAQPAEGDIALLKLKNPFQYSRSTRPISLGYIGANARVLMLGWGSESNENLEMSPGLKYVNMITKSSDSFCREDEKHICAVAPPGEGACLGDSGGPLVGVDSKKLVGVNSAGSRYCGTGIADTFTRVYPYWNWISYIKTYN